MAKHKVLSTKKLDPSMKEMAGKEGIDILEQDAILIRPILTKAKWDEILLLLQKRIPYAVFTSSNAVSALKKYLNDYVNHLPPHWKIFCLSGKTKTALQEAEGLFGTIEATASSAAELAQAVIAGGAKEVLFFCGDRRREELPAVLHAAGVVVHEVVIYEVKETPVSAPGDYEAVVFFSPSAVQSFFAANQLKENAVCFAIGQTTAASVKQFTENKLYISKEPTQESLLKEVITYFQTT